MADQPNPWRRHDNDDDDVEILKPKRKSDEQKQRDEERKRAKPSENRPAFPRPNYATVGNGVSIRPSTLGPQAGNGLFADRDFAEGEPITIYDGFVIDRAESLRLLEAGNDSHIREHVLQRWYIDGLRMADGTLITNVGMQLRGLGGAAYVNHKRGPDANAKWAQLDSDYMSRQYEVFERNLPADLHWSQRYTYLRAKGDIDAGDEIFVDYGFDYGLGDDPEPQYGDALDALLYDDEYEEDREELNDMEEDQAEIETDEKVAQILARLRRKWRRRNPEQPGAPVVQQPPPPPPPAAAAINLGRGDAIGAQYTQAVEELAREMRAWDDAEIATHYRGWQRKLLASTTRNTKEKKLTKFYDLLKTALDKREQRLQAQMPLDGRSILSFLKPRRNERLLNLALHPVLFHPDARNMRWESEKYDKLPLTIPNFNLDAINNVLRKIHTAYRAPPGGAVDAWVEEKRAVLAQFATVFGFDQPFEPFTKQQPYVPNGSIVAWDSFHATNDRFTDAHGVLQTTNEFYGTVFLDYCPRRLFSENVWRIIFACHRVSIVDIGAGPSLYRGSEWTFKYGEAMAAQQLPVTTGVPANFRADLLHYLGAPRPAVVTALPVASQADVALTFRDGYSVTRVAGLDAVYQATWKEFRDFFQWMMLDSETDFALNAQGRVIVPSTGAVASINLVHPAGPDLQLLTATLGGTIGRRKASEVLGFGKTNAFWRRKKDGTRGAGGQFLSKISQESGMGVASSYYGGANHLLLQCLIAPTFELLYGEPVVVIPERFRVKLNTTWANWHVDHAPLPDAVRVALEPFVRARLAAVVQAPVVVAVVAAPPEENEEDEDF